MYYCAQDIMEYLMNSVGGGAQDSEHRLLRSAAVHAYRDVINARDWSWHVAETGLVNEESVGSGTGALTFTLPANVKNIDAIITAHDNPTATVYLPPTEWLRVNRKLPTLRSPVYWTVVKDPATADRWLLKLAGSPDITQGYWYTYRRRPPPLHRMGFEPECRDQNSPLMLDGMVIRYGTDTALPDGLGGRNRITGEEIVGLSGSFRSYDGSVSEPLVVTSDYVDASDSMFTAILSGAEVWMARMMGKNVEGALAVYNRDLRMAFEADSVAPLSGTRSTASFTGRARALGYYSPSGPDTGV